MTAIGSGRGRRHTVETVGRSAVLTAEAVGLAASVFAEAVYWAAMGRRRGQPVRPVLVFAQMMEVGIGALPIVSVLAGTIGLMLALQGVHALEPFGAQRQVTLGVALSVVREFGPLITGIIVAGRSGSALAARLGSMTINEEIDALRVMGINPVRFLVVPNLLATLVMLPALALWANLVALVGAGWYITTELGMSFAVFADEVIRLLSVDDLTHGLWKALIFGGLISLVGVINGIGATGGAEGVGRATTRSVVQAITAIVLADMVFVYAAMQ